MSAIIITSATQKGGEGKTATVQASAGAMASLGKKVLMIDLDPQGSLSSHFLKEIPSKTSAEVFFKKKFPTIQVGENLYLVPADVDLLQVESNMEGPEDQLVLRDALKSVKDNYDYIFIDCPPAQGWLLMNAMASCDILLVPMSMDSKALEGVSKIAEASLLLLEKPAITRVLFTKYNPRLKVTKIVEPKARSRFGSIIMNTKIRYCTKLSECGEHYKDIISYAPSCNAAEDYRALSAELLEIIGEMTKLC